NHLKQHHSERIDRTFRTIRAAYSCDYASASGFTGGRTRRHLPPRVRGPGRRLPVTRHGTCAAPALARRATVDAGGLPAPRTPAPLPAPHSRAPLGTGSAVARPVPSSADVPLAPPAPGPTPPRSTTTVDSPPAAGFSATPALPRTRS